MSAKPKIWDINDVSPHLCTQDPVTGNQHVIPLSLIRDLRDGTIAVDACEEWKPMVRALMYALVAYADEDLPPEEG